MQTMHLPSTMLLYQPFPNSKSWQKQRLLIFMLIEPVEQTVYMPNI
jgi:hypothetical protein